MSLKELYVSSGVRSRMMHKWNAIVDKWLCGEASHDDELKPWFNAYSGRGDHAVVPEALPEPWLGELDSPEMVFLALNPGSPFLGNGETWRNGTVMPDLQSRRGVFADEIRQAGSYAAWARRVPDWPRWAPTPNTFFTTRERILQDWLEDRSATLDDALNLELFPWHSVSFNASAFKPDRVAQGLIDRYVLTPAAETGCPFVFALGSAWFMLLERLGFEAIFTLSTETGDVWRNMPRHRVITIYRRHEMRIVAERHMGGFGPPKRTEVAPLRERLMPHLVTTG